MEGLENGALYAVLYYRGEATSWHWSLFLPNPSVTPIGKDGTSFQVSDASPGSTATTSTDANDQDGIAQATSTSASTATAVRRWRYGCSAENIVESLRTVLCVKLGDVHLLGTYHDAVQWLHDTLSAVPVVPPPHPRPLPPPTLTPCLIAPTGNGAPSSSSSASSLSSLGGGTPPQEGQKKNNTSAEEESLDLGALELNLKLDLTLRSSGLEDRERTRGAQRDPAHEWTCRAWFLAAVADLHELGILSCHNVTMLEQEIKNRAVLATMSFVDWGGTTVCSSKHCS
jgi:hypothetical protein